MTKHLFHDGRGLLLAKETIARGVGSAIGASGTNRRAAMTVLGLAALGVATVVGVSTDHRARPAQSDAAASLQTLQAQLADARAAAGRAEQRLQQLIDDRRAQAGDPDGNTKLDPVAVADRLAHLEAANLDAARELAAAKAERDRLATKLADTERVAVRAMQEQKRAEMAAAAAERERRMAAAAPPRREGATVAASADDGERDSASAPDPRGRFDLERFLGQFGIRKAAEGGPFVAPGSLGRSSPEAVRLLHSLPLSAPLVSYRVESPFGERSDPINGREAFHTGVDLSAPYRSPVYNTAPGTVVFAGYAAAYGKLVEIDHGHGIHTKYAHLNRITVTVGQHLLRRTRIGLLGSTGRSTGPHVHYEVTVNGVPQNPESFLRVGRSIVEVRADQ